MSVVPVPPGIPGIRSLMAAYPQTGGPLMALAQSVLRGQSPLSEGERELLAVAVSVENTCAYCSKSHAAVARLLLGPHASWVDDILAGNQPHGCPTKLAALLQVARSVARSGHNLSSQLLVEVRNAGASDREIHDTVLVAAAFSLFNRYVDGLGAPEPENPEAYRSIGERLARSGYV